MGPSHPELGSGQGTRYKHEDHQCSKPFRPRACSRQGMIFKQEITNALINRPLSWSTIRGKALKVKDFQRSKCLGGYYAATPTEALDPLLCDCPALHSQPI